MRTRPGRRTRYASSSAGFADPEVAYVCGQLNILDGRRREQGRRLLALRDGAARPESRSARSPAATARSTRCADRLRRGRPALRARPLAAVPDGAAGRRAVCEPAAHAWEKPTPSNETEYRRKVRMFERCWLIVLRGKMLRRLGPLYLLEIISHRLFRYGAGILGVVLLCPRSRWSRTVRSTPRCWRRSWDCSPPRRRV